MKTACRSNTRTQPGFTLIELVVTVSIVAILATVAVPNFRTFILNNRIKSTTQSLMSSFQLARSEAIKRQANVVICLTGSSSTCTTGTPTKWIVFADSDKDGVIDTGEEIIDSKTIDSPNVFIAVDNENKTVTYLPSGFTSTSSTTDSDLICITDIRGNTDANGGATGTSVARGMVITSTGRIRLTSVISEITCQT